MSMQNNQRDEKEGVNVKSRRVAVAVNAKKASKNAVKWVVEKLLTRGETIVLIHVQVKPAAPSSISTTSESYIYLHVFYTLKM